MGWTFVTGFFPIHGCRNLQFYLDHAKGTLDLDVNMVIFCNENLVPQIKEMRSGHGRTVIVSMEKEEFEYFRYLDRVRENRSRDTFHRDPRNTSEYYLLVCSKFSMVHWAVENNPFESSYFAWIDFGISHAAYVSQSVIDKVIDKNRDLFSLCCIHYRHKNEVLSPDFCRGLSMFAGGFFSASLDKMQSMLQRFKKEFLWMLEEGLGHSEETVISRTYHQFPFEFELYYGDYESCVCNHAGIEKSGDHVVNLCVIPLRNLSVHQEGYNLSKNLWKSGILSSWWEVENNMSLFICAFYVGDYETCLETLEELHRRKDLHELIRSRLHNILTNADHLLPFIKSKWKCIEIPDKNLINMYNSDRCMKFSFDTKEYTIDSIYNSNLVILPPSEREKIGAIPGIFKINLEENHPLVEDVTTISLNNLQEWIIPEHPFPLEWRFMKKKDLEREIQQYIITHYGGIFYEEEVPLPSLSTKVTYTTMFFQIDRPNEAYFEWMKNLFALSIYLVVYTDGESMGKIRKLAARREDVTRIVLVDKTPWKEQIDEIKDSFSRHSFETIDTNKDTPSFIFLMEEKYNLLRETIGWNPFGHSFFGWVDIGISKVARRLDLFEKIQPPLKVRNCHICYNSWRDIQDEKIFSEKFVMVLLVGF